MLAWPRRPAVTRPSWPISSSAIGHQKLLVANFLTQASGIGEWAAALLMVAELPRPLQPRGASLKTIGLMREIQHWGLRRVGRTFTFAVAAYSLVRLRRLTKAPA